MRWFSLSRPNRRLPLYRVIAAIAEYRILRRRKSRENKCYFNWDFCDRGSQRATKAWYLTISRDFCILNSRAT
jgi:hypothetical protein